MEGGHSPGTLNLLRGMPLGAVCFAAAKKTPEMDGDTAG
jgi:hypothetical protein